MADALYTSTLALVQERVGNDYDFNFLKNLSSLHSEVPTPMRLKYLLFKLKKAMKRSHKLDNCNIHFDKFDIQAPSITFSKTKEFSFVPEQLYDLNELLVEFAHKWRSIGEALRFKPQDLNNIQACPTLFSEAPSSYLTKVLEEWLSKRLKHVLPPTKENLKEVLCSHMVGLAILSNKIPALLSSSECGVLYSLITVTVDKTLTVKVSSEFVKLEEGKGGTFLEVGIINCTQSKITSECCWFVSDKPDTLCSSPSLYIKSDIDESGCKYFCEVHCKLSAGFSSIKAPPVMLQVSCPLDEYKVDLASVYLAQPEVPENTWPPVGNKKYITLALIKQQRVNYGSEYARLTIRGDMDDILQHKQIIEYEELLRSLKSGQLVFIEGRPGSGKTTFVHKIAQDWAKSSNGGIRLLLLISLRVLNTFFKPDLSDILKLFRNLKVSHTLIEERDGKGVCFIFDGFDEFSPKDGEKSIVYEIINRKYLTKSTVVVASRPAAIAKLKYRADKVIEVLGFMSNQILEYFDCYPFSDDSKASQSKAASLQDYLSSHPNVFHMCYLPIHAAMIAFLFKVTGKVPKTETEIYRHFTNFTLKRSLTKIKQVEVEYTDIANWSGVEQEYFRQICRLAWEKTLLNKQVLCQDEVSSYFQVRKDEDMSLGLITVDRTAGLYGYKDIYTFLHLTFQEYLAAYHVSTLSDEEQIKFIQKHGRKNHMLVVWKFYCGLIEIKPCDMKFKSILRSTKGKTFFHIQCAYESQEKIACAQLLKAINYHIRLENEYTRIPDFTAIGFLINTSVLPFKLSLINCNVDGEAIDGLLSEIKDKNKLSLESLHVETVDTDMECIKKLVTNAPSLKQFFLRSLSREANNPVDVSFVWSTNITELSLVNVNIMLMNFENLRMLKSKLSLESLHVETDDTDMECIKNLVTNAPSLKQFFLGSLSKKVNDVGFVWSTSITELSLVNVKFMFLQHSKSKLSLESLHVEANDTDLECIKKLIGSFSREVEVPVDVNLVWSTNTTELSIVNVNIKPDMLMNRLHFENLRILNLSGSIIEFNSQYMTLLDHLRHSKNLRELNVSNTCITKRGAKVLALSLKNCPCLEKINIRDNSIPLSGIVAILSSVQQCSLEVKGEEVIYQKSFRLSDGDLLKCLESFANLQSLKVSLTSTDVIFFCLSCKSWSNLKELHLSLLQSGSVPATIIKDISKCLQYLKQLQTLVLKNCMTKGRGVEDLISSLRQCPNLQVLDLSDNQIRPEELKAILGGLKRLVNLKELFLTNNDIGDVGAKFLSSHCQNLLLHKLDIQNNGISSEAISALKSSIRHCENLSSLVLNF